MTNFQIIPPLPRGRGDRGEVEAMVLIKRHLSRVLRQNQTPWENKLWRVLKNRNIENLKFRRQCKIGRYIVDFCCPNKKLIIELDGSHHNLKTQEIEDQIRQKYLESQGYKTLRIWNNEIENNLEGVVERIIQTAQPHPSPLPDGRGR